MALRFTQSEKWNTSFMRSLKAPYKLLWMFLMDECNHGGIWDVDIEFAEMRTDCRGLLNKAEAETLFAEKIIVINDKNSCFWFIPEFIQEQYKSMLLNPKNRAHPVKILSVYGILSQENNFFNEKGEQLLRVLDHSELINKEIKQGAYEAPTQGRKDKDRDKEADKVKDKEKRAKENFEAAPAPTTQPAPGPEPVEEPVIAEIMPVTYEGMTLEAALKGFKEMRVKKRAPMTGLAENLNKTKLQKISGGNEELKIAILQQSILCAWTDIYPLKDDFLKGYKQKKEEQSSKLNNAIDLATNAIYQEAV